jgi:hypothetical protein
VINSLGNSVRQVESISIALFDILGFWLCLVIQLKGSSWALSSAYPEIQRPTKHLAVVWNVQTDEAIARMPDAAIQLINQSAKNSRYDLIQF